MTQTSPIHATAARIDLLNVRIWSLRSIPTLSAADAHCLAAAETEVAYLQQQIQAAGEATRDAFAAAGRAAGEALDVWGTPPVEVVEDGTDNYPGRTLAPVVDQVAVLTAAVGSVYAEIQTALFWFAKADLFNAAIRGNAQGWADSIMHDIDLLSTPNLRALLVALNLRTYSHPVATAPRRDLRSRVCLHLTEAIRAAESIMV